MDTQVLSVIDDELRAEQEEQARVSNSCFRDWVSGVISARFTVGQPQSCVFEKSWAEMQEVRCSGPRSASCAGNCGFAWRVTEATEARLPDCKLGGLSGTPPCLEGFSI